MVWKVNTYNHITEIEPGETIPRVVATVVRKENMPMIATTPEMYELLEQLRTKIVQEGIQDIVFATMFSEEILLIDKVLQKARGEGE